MRIAHIKCKNSGNGGPSASSQGQKATMVTVSQMTMPRMSLLVMPKIEHEQILNG